MTGRGIFGGDAGSLAHIATPWIWPLAIATITVGSFGAYAAPSLRLLTANMVIVSVGTLLVSFVINDGQSLSVGLFYLQLSTAAAGALFLIADQVRVQRGPAQDRFVISRPMQQAGIHGSFFFMAAIAIIGLPPLSGFIGKALLLNATVRFEEQLWVWPVLLASSLVALIAFSRAGTLIFWRPSGKKASAEKTRPTQILAISILLTMTTLMTIFAGPLVAYSERAANDIQHSTKLVQHKTQSDRSTIHAPH